MSFVYIKLYNLGVLFYRFILSVLSFRNKKAKQWIEGRKNIFENLQLKLSKQEQNIWIHCASLGEFEQGRPLIEALKKRHPRLNIVLTFFSPSGYEIRKNYKGADAVFYLPLDTPGNARRFIEIVCPKIAVFMKYEFWYHYLQVLQNENISVFLVSANFQEHLFLFRYYGKPWLQLLKKQECIFVQNKPSYELLRSYDFDNVRIAYDTRFDRVYQNMLTMKETSDTNFPYAVFETFKGEKSVFVAGSTWPEDEKILTELINSQLNDMFKFIFASHEIKEAHIDTLVQNIKLKCVRLSAIIEKEDRAILKDAEVLIIDSIGLLSKIYRYGDMAYIGGGFGKGIHNILEAAAFGLPVIFGPNYHFFQEARDLIERKGAFCIQNEKELQAVFNLLNEPAIYEKAAKVCTDYVEEHTGGTEMILDYLEKFI